MESLKKNLNYRLKTKTESQFSPKRHSKGTQWSHQDCGDCSVSQEVSNLANSHCQENHKDTTCNYNSLLAMITEFNLARLFSERATSFHYL